MLQALLDVEAALARAQAALGVIPADAAADDRRGPPSRRRASTPMPWPEARGTSATIVDPVRRGAERRASRRSTPAPRATCTGAPPARTSWTRRSLPDQSRRRSLTRDHAALARHTARAVRSARRRRDARPHAAAAGDADHVRAEGGRLVRRRAPQLGARRSRARRGCRADPVRRRRRHARRARRSRPRRRRGARARAERCRRPTRPGTPRATGSPRWSPPARSTRASSARSRATSAC